MGFFEAVFGEGKKWKVGKHRVKKYQVIQRGTAPHGVSDKVAGQRKDKYKCVDCEKEFYRRKDFESEKCYEVI